MAKEAERLFNGLSNKEKNIVKRGFLALVRLGEGTKDTRRRVQISEMVAHGETPNEVHKALLKFSKTNARLITMSDETLEITHETLLEHWQMLKTWIKDNRENIHFRIKLSEAVKEWNKDGKIDGLLWWESPNRNKLEEFYHKYAPDMTELQIEFYMASIDKADKVKKIEEKRQEGENARIIAEQERIKAEKRRQEAENARKKAEQEKIEADKKRQEAENARIIAEQERNSIRSSFTYEFGEFILSALIIIAIFYFIYWVRK